MGFPIEMKEAVITMSPVQPLPIVPFHYQGCTFRSRSDIPFHKTSVCYSIYRRLHPIPMDVMVFFLELFLLQKQNP